MNTGHLALKMDFAQDEFVVAIMPRSHYVFTSFSPTEDSGTLYWNHWSSHNNSVTRTTLVKNMGHVMEGQIAYGNIFTNIGGWRLGFWSAGFSKTLLQTGGS